MEKIALGFLLGLISFLLLFFIGEPALYHLGDVALIPILLVMAVYFFICQLNLSRGHPDALRRDWPIMLALDAVWIVVIIIMFFVERLEVILAQGVGILISCFGATLAGAFVAAKKAGKE